MKFDRIFYKCEHCKNILVMIDDFGPSVSCCGEKMVKLTSNTVEAAKEKHIPDVSIENGVVKVKIGAVEHPQTEEHHIGFIALATEDATYIKKLSKDEKPYAEFNCIEGNFTVYEYCNLHGLWAIDVENIYKFKGEACSSEFPEGCK